ncbi:bifunctional DNA primase/polymerase [Nocardia terpenica]|uniref:DNA primase/polymerase bifunctional N-terminal domain-containing protein n=1 Tax=Nocardia terpenica TaxID=455432 RepID=A0A6G9ZDA4_9NOCA|nr:bifunctional DNA primase/polymerase [Nocardia terpenica]QIS23327.1 hypothetical protein F6W96_38325 [Nocardia terpenica]
MTGGPAAGTAAHLNFYLDRGCVVVPCRPGTKKLVRGAGEWTAEQSRSNRDALSGNAAMRNGTGGLLVVDVDAKNGGSLDVLAERFPGSTWTRTIQTVSKGEHGFGVQLVYALPDGFNVRPVVLVRDDQGRPMVEVAPFAMLPGSRARGADGVMRSYEVVRDMSPWSPTPELLAAVEGRPVVVETAEQIPADDDPVDARARLGSLLARIAAAGAGQRNEVFTQNALPVVRLCTVLGEDPEMALTTAYEQSGGGDRDWVTSAVRSAIRRAGEEPSGRLGLGPLAAGDLDRMQTWARFAPWPGKSGASDRRVFLAVVGACRDHARTDTALGKRKLALRAGLSEETVEAALKRLEAAGRLEIIKADPWVYRRPLLPSNDDTTHILPPLVRGISNTRDMCMGVGALHPLWSVPKTREGLGLDGRHGHLFDLVCAGLTSARALADHIRSRPDSVSRTLARLVEVELLVKTGIEYAPAPLAGELADRLALELGGIEVCAYRENRYRDEAKKWDDYRRSREEPEFRWDPLTGEQWLALPDGIRVEDIPVDGRSHADESTELSEDENERLAKEYEEFQRRRWHEKQELLQQLGLPNELYG